MKGREGQPVNVEKAGQVPLSTFRKTFISPVLHSRRPSSEINRSWGLRADSDGGLPMRVQAGRVRLAHRASPAPDQHCLNPYKAPELP